jgi:ADP-ribose pyrophosphatase YjhB (NUDIX family)
MDLQVGVKILLKNKEGKCLVACRSAEKYPEVGAKWDIVGGRITPGIPLIENLKREVREETGLEIIYEPKLITAQDILRIKDLGNT